MNPNHIPGNPEPEAQKNVPDELGDRRDDSDAGRQQTINITGNVITGGTVNQAIFHEQVTGPLHTGSGNINYIDIAALLRASRQWLDNTLDLADIPPHLNTSWAGQSVYVMRRLARGFTGERWWTLSTALTLWVATVWLVTPILQWPLADAPIRGRACWFYAIATFVLPFFVALTAPVDRRAEINLDTRRAYLRFWFLKLSGAYTGFSLVAGIVGIAMIAYYLGWTLPRGLQWLLVLVPLFFSHIGARRIPGDRLQMFGEVRVHEIDRLVILGFLMLGPGLAAFAYWGYAVIAQPGMGLLLLIALSAVVLWEVRNQQHIVLSDRMLIAIVGLLLPLVVLLLIFVFTLSTMLPTAGDWLLLALTIPYFLGTTLLFVTSFVRNPPILTIRGVFGLVAVFLGMGYALSINLWVGQGFVVAVVLFWVIWGQTRLGQVFLDASQLGLVAGGAGWRNRLVGAGSLIGWLNALGFAVVALLLTAWAYRSSASPDRTLPT